MLPPTSYQGGKQRLAADIVSRIHPPDDRPFYDLCCGSGAVSLELVSRGFPVDKVVLADAGPWGTFWESICEGSFNLTTFREYLSQIPTDPSMIAGHMKALSKRPASVDTPYVFLLLQAASFGGKSVWVEGDRWENCTFRSYWLPTETSSRRSPVNPMMPMPSTLNSRVEIIRETMRGATVYHGNVEDLIIPERSTVYVDPPYRDTTKYGHELNFAKVVERTTAPCYVSEGRALSPTAVKLAEGRAKGGISGGRQKPANEEWLSGFNLLSSKVLDAA